MILKTKETKRGIFPYNFPVYRLVLQVTWHNINDNSTFLCRRFVGAHSWIKRDRRLRWLDVFFFFTQPVETRTRILRFKVCENDELHLHVLFSFGVQQTRVSK